MTTPADQSPVLHNADATAQEQPAARQRRHLSVGLTRSPREIE